MECAGCRTCFEFWMFWMWVIQDVRCCKCGMFEMWDARDMGCLGRRMWDEGFLLRFVILVKNMLFLKILHTSKI